MKRRKIAAIDVGSTKVCSVMADTDGVDLRILGVGVSPSRGLQKGLVVNLNDAKESIRQSVQMAEQAAGYKMESALISITGRHISSVNNRGVIAVTSNRQMVRPEDVERVLKVVQNVEQANISGSTILHLIPQHYAVDGQEGIKNPVGMHGFRLDVEAHIVTAAVTAVENLTKCIRGVGIEVDGLIFSPLASAEAVLTEDERQNGVIMADIGGGTTDIAVIRDNNIFHTSVMPVAGHSISHDISVGLGISFELAEEIKKKYASVEPGEEKLADRTLTEAGHTVPYGELHEIVRTRVEELLRLIMLELPNDSNKYIRSGMVLTGGTTNLPGIAQLGLEVTHMPVRIGMPPQLYGVSDSLVDPAYSTSVGLLLWELSNSGNRPQKNESPNRSFMSDLGGLFSRKKTN
jgi:cell division protein FtsA